MSRIRKPIPKSVRELVYKKNMTGTTPIVDVEKKKMKNRLTIQNLIDCVFCTEIARTEEEIEIEKETEKMKSALENCPICGEKIEFDKCLLESPHRPDYNGYYTGYRICCQKCGITTSKEYLSKLGAMIAWNDLSRIRKDK